MIRQSANRFLWLPTISSKGECVFSALSAVRFGALTASDRGELAKLPELLRKEV